ncbi:ArsR/SmtB family transcription factor [Nocardia terpenica]|uniref:Metalloregulator ArsR/SmtB family transcription factor n=1 Tax=Nocardia terpenica TaxID=455432 RepID=A0A6G9Z5Z6_9NOCA|nr:metalloregulator ArsR/SmtB family transcription factor [Nocardia terpenica]QIS20894.1 metalloregulator ArsR/SmtB family transcription factor [Nocardia terpenica]
MRELPHPATEDIQLTQVMHALSDPARLEIVARLADGDENCTVIGNGIELHKSTLSHHYRVLREAGLTRTTADGRSRLVRLRRDDLNDRFPGLLDSVLAALRSPSERALRIP